MANLQKKAQPIVRHPVSMIDTEVFIAAKSETIRRGVTMERYITDAVAHYNALCAAERAEKQKEK